MLHIRRVKETRFGQDINSIHRVLVYADVLLDAYIEVCLAVHVEKPK